mmetsp:Transcript_140674/g.449744  ORF Transcript_140674/g.449744 Transcript_140674/m.449744 type:complete len:203 (-) Transcript_140674:425-1033(-)
MVQHRRLQLGGSGQADAARGLVDSFYRLAEGLDPLVAHVGGVALVAARGPALAQRLVQRLVGRLVHRQGILVAEVGDVILVCALEPAFARRLVQRLVGRLVQRQAILVLQRKAALVAKIGGAAITGDLRPAFAHRLIQRLAERLVQRQSIVVTKVGGIALVCACLFVRGSRGVRKLVDRHIGTLPVRVFRPSVARRLVWQPV